jgi:Est1 DNA/RNA binding domain
MELTSRSFDNPAVVKMLEEVIQDRAVEAKFLNRLTFINLSALYVATQREQQNVLQFLETILAQYTLLLRLLSTELDSTSPSTDIQSHITAIIRRTAPALRLYSKWLVLHHSQISSTPFWTQYIATSNSLQKLWPSPSNPPKLSYPLEEDLAAAGFVLFEIPNTTTDLRKRKHKRDRARIGNRKKGFDKLLLQWGRSGGDSSVTSTRNQGAEHPNVEMTLRLADLLSDAVELASIPVPT